MEVTITTSSVNPSAVAAVLNAHWPHMSHDGNGWHFAEVRRDDRIVITWIGKQPANSPTRLDLMAVIRRRLEDAGFRCYDLDYFDKLCVAVRRHAVTYTAT